MAYSQASRTQPDASTQNGTNFGASALANDRAAIDAIVLGHAPGWVYSVSGGTAEQPQYMFWKNGTHWLRATLTWGSSGGSNGNITQAVLQLSANSGTDYTTSPGGTLATVVQAFDANGNLTSTTGGGSFGGFLSYLIGKVKGLVTSLAAHIAGTGTSVHGLGTMSTQNKTAVDIDGGTLDDVQLAYRYARGKLVSYGSISGSGTFDWTNADVHVATIGGAITLSWANLPPSNQGGAITLVLTNPGAFTVTWPAGVKWPGGIAPTRTASGVDVYEFLWDGASVRGVQAQKASA